MTAFPVQRRHLILWLAAVVIAVGFVVLWAGVAVAGAAGSGDSLADLAAQMMHGRLDRLQRILLVVGALGVISGVTVAFGYTAFTALDHRRE